MANKHNKSRVCVCPLCGGGNEDPSNLNESVKKAQHQAHAYTNLPTHLSDAEFDLLFDECSQLIRKQLLKPIYRKLEISKCRRKTAVRSFIDSHKEKYDRLYGNSFCIDDALIRLEAMAPPLLDQLEQHGIFAGAAYWIADYLKKTQKLPEAGAFLCHDDKILSIIPFPSASLQSVPLKLLKSIVHAIYTRDNAFNRSIITKDTINAVPHNYATPFTFGPDEISIPEIMAIYKDCSGRDRFNALVSLIDQDTIDKAVASFKEKFDLIVDAYIEVAAKKIREIRNCSVELESAMEEQRRDIKALNNTPPAGSPMMRDMQSHFTLLQDINKKTRKYSMALSNLVKANQAYSNFFHELLAYVFKYNTDREQQRSILFQFQPILKRLDAVSIDDPFEICFAFLYLLDNGNDLVWNSSISYILGAFACYQLPWGNMEDVYGDVLTTQESKRVSIADMEIPDPNHILFSNEYKNVFFENPINLAQIIHDATGCSIGHIEEDSFKKFYAISKLSGFDAKQSEILGILLPFLLNGYRGTESEHFESYPWYDDDDGADTESYSEDEDEDYSVDKWFDTTYTNDNLNNEIEKERDKDQEIDELRASLKQLRKENNSLKKQAHDMSVSVRDQKKTIESMKLSLDGDRQELADLREYVYNTQNNIAESNDTDPELPDTYETASRMAVFGGHDTWLKAIRPMLPNVTFVGKDQKPSADMIRYADIIWIQPNAISHANFYLIMNVARANNKQVRYFTNASARKCYEQLIEADRKIS